MIEIVTKTKTWGNSVGIILPKRLGFEPDQEVKVHLEIQGEFTRGRDIFGKLKLKRPTREVLKEIDEELDIEA